jgi:hypothetical protein
MQITSRISHASVKVYINETLHIHYLREKYVGMQSWQYEDEKMFYVELTLEGGVIRCDYDRRDLWLGVLVELAKAR